MYVKNFDEWSTQKKQVDTAPNKRYRTRDVWWCSLGVNVGFEQDGTGIGYQRPVLIVRAVSTQVCFAIPLTTSPAMHPNRIQLGIIGGRHASAIITQLRLIDTRRLINKIGVLEKEKFEEIKKAIRDLF